MAIGAEAVRSMEVRGSWGQLLGQAQAARMYLAQTAEGVTQHHFSRSASQSAYFVRGSFIAEGENNQWKVNMKSRLTIVARRWCRAIVARRARDRIASPVWSIHCG